MSSLDSPILQTKSKVLNLDSNCSNPIKDTNLTNNLNHTKNANHTNSLNPQSTKLAGILQEGNVEIFENIDTNTRTNNTLVSLPPVTASKTRPQCIYESPRPLHTKAKITFRLAEKGDYDKGYPSILSQLTNLGEIRREEYEKRLEDLSILNSRSLDRFLYWIVVGEDIDLGKIVCCATLFIEPKFIHHCGSVGHIEDVVVDNDYRNLRIGQKLLDILISIGKDEGCYKIILDCNDENVPFYETLGFKVNSVHMAMYVDENDKTGSKYKSKSYSKESNDRI